MHLYHTVYERPAIVQRLRETGFTFAALQVELAINNQIPDCISDEEVIAIRDAETDVQFSSLDNATTIPVFVVLDCR